MLLPTPPKKFAPVIVIVAAARLDPVDWLSAETTGAAAVTVNAEDAVALSVRPAASAYAVIVTLVVYVRGPLYIVEVPFGALPSAVYLIVALPVPVEMDTVTVPV